MIDAIPVVPFGGYAVALEGLLAGWHELGVDDEVHILLTEGVDLEIPKSMRVHRHRVGRPELVRRVAVQSRAARRTCRAVNADVLLGMLPTTAVVPVGCPKVITVYDLRHELLPEQFSRGRRLIRRLSYGIGYRQARGVICISERTRGDLLRSRPWLSSKVVVAVHFGADHVDSWPRDEPPSGDEPYALAFGHFPNKAVERVIDAWEILRDSGEGMKLVFVGLPSASRDRIAERLRSANLDGLITALPWLDDDEFHARFASSGLIVFPSDFEGFGLPAVEAMRLGIPLVISSDDALLEVTGGNAAVAAGSDPAALAAAVSAARAKSHRELERARTFAARYNWEATARETRRVLAQVSLSSSESGRPA